MVPHAAIESLCTLLEAGQLGGLRELSLPGRWEKDGLALLLWTLSGGALPRLQVCVVTCGMFRYLTSDCRLSTVSG